MQVRDGSAVAASSRIAFFTSTPFSARPRAGLFPFRRSTMTNPPFVPAFDMTAFLARQAEFDKRASGIFPVNKAAVLSVLARAGITLVTVRFDGGGDSGQIDEIDARSDRKSVV